MRVAGSRDWSASSRSMVCSTLSSRARMCPESSGTSSSAHRARLRREAASSVGVGGRLVPREAARWWCICAVVRPRSRASSTARARTGPSTSSVEASEQNSSKPSSARGTKLQATAESVDSSRAGWPQPPMRVQVMVDQATGVGTRSQPLRARATDSSTSGLRPCSRTRRSLTMRSPVAASCSPRASAGSEGAGRMTEVLDCSPVVTRSLGARWAMARAPASPRTVPASSALRAQARQKAGWWAPSTSATCVGDP